MDVGGTMDPYYEPVSQLLTALHEERGLRDFEPYYFHNCVYDHVYTERAACCAPTRVPTGDVLRRLDARWKVVIVGDAAMHPGRAARALRQHRSAPRRADARASSGCSASPSTSTAACGSIPTGAATGTAARRRASSGASSRCST